MACLLKGSIYTHWITTINSRDIVPLTRLQKPKNISPGFHQELSGTLEEAPGLAKTQPFL